MWSSVTKRHCFTGRWLIHAAAVAAAENQRVGKTRRRSIYNADRHATDTTYKPAKTSGSTQLKAGCAVKIEVNDIFKLDYYHDVLRSVVFVGYVVSSLVGCWFVRLYLRWHIRPLARNGSRCRSCAINIAVPFSGR